MSICCLGPRRSESWVYRFGDLTLDWRTRHLTRSDGTRIVLSSGEYALLLVFLDKPDRTFTREQLLRMTRLHQSIAGLEFSSNFVRCGHSFEFLSNVLGKLHEPWSEFRELLRPLYWRCATAIEDQHGPAGSVIKCDADHVDSWNQPTNSDKKAFLVYFDRSLFNSKRDFPPFAASRLAAYSFDLPSEWLRTAKKLSAPTMISSNMSPPPHLLVHASKRDHAPGPSKPAPQRLSRFAM
jgi:hypothetical protein